MIEDSCVYSSVPTEAVTIATRHSIIYAALLNIFIHHNW